MRLHLADGLRAGLKENSECQLGNQAHAACIPQTTYCTFMQPVAMSEST